MGSDEIIDASRQADMQWSQLVAHDEAWIDCVTFSGRGRSGRSEKDEFCDRSSRDSRFELRSS